MPIEVEMFLNEEEEIAIQVASNVYKNIIKKYESMSIETLNEKQITVYMRAAEASANLALASAKSRTMFKVANSIIEEGDRRITLVRRLHDNRKNGIYPELPDDAIDVELVPGEMEIDPHQLTLEDIYNDKI